MSTSVKITENQVERINQLLKAKDLGYKSRNDFVVKAVENEIRIADLKTVFTRTGKIHFDMLYNEHVRKAWERAHAFNFQTQEYKEMEARIKEDTKKEDKKEKKNGFRG